MNNTKNKTLKRKRRHAKVRAKIVGTATRPRLTVFRSNKAIYAQIIDDSSATTIASANDVAEKKGTNVERAAVVGAMLAKAALDKKITDVVFDRSGYLYAGRVKALAEAARSAGLNF